MAQVPASMLILEMCETRAAGGRARLGEVVLVLVVCDSFDNTTGMLLRSSGT